MADQKKQTRMEEIQASIEEKFNELEVAIVKDDIKKAHQVDAELKELESEYAEEKERLLYAELAKMPNPILEAIKTYEYTVVTHKATAKNGVITDITRGTKLQRINLLKFCTRARLDTSWQYRISRLNQLLCLRVARELGFTTTEMRELEGKMFFDKKLREIEMGGTPDSNNQLCKMLQSCIDEIIYEETGKNTNAYKCNNHDVSYLLDLYTKRGKGRLVVNVAKDNFLRSIIVDVLYRIVTDSRYSVDGFKVAKEPIIVTPIVAGGEESSEAPENSEAPAEKSDKKSGKKSSKKSSKKPDESAE